MTLGEKIKDARTEAGLTQAQLAQRMGLREGAMAAVCKWETDQRHPTIETLAKIAKGLSVSVSAFLNELPPAPKATQHAYPLRGAATGGKVPFRTVGRPFKVKTK